ncbi:hypothetical protein C1645_831847 [Glomus cerebriforme]|uniref:Protein kinase domain-containing protein n=1 Tax=Glomus cerebriforme TaxID=658196 RepID=A0A397SES0_9GLOM|nr:hypothetical protein C1645_831847 [Glomus cerebriforme]
MMVMEYAEDGNLRQKLNEDFNPFNWWEKFNILRYIANGFCDTHKEKVGMNTEILTKKIGHRDHCLY